ncbi:MAG: sugar-binding transcriptional regulator [Vicinamibacterales bacterium]|nr:sugar-binding transcriptional regulator [Vicinamibacterales bacterium]
MARLDEVRLLAKVARMYHQHGLTQAEITTRLHVHQSTVSRLLKRAEREGIVRISLAVPSGIYPELEETLQTTYGLSEAIVVESIDEEEQVVRDLGAAAAYYLETTLRHAEVIGISSFSAALLAMVEAMHPTTRARNTRVVQILGGVGNPGAEAHATLLTRRLANLVSGSATLLPAPGIIGSAAARDVLLQDRFVQEATNLFQKVSLALVGIGSIEPSKVLAASGNVFSSQELDLLRARGAVGDVCLRFFDAAGRPVPVLDERVISIELPQLRRVDRVVGVAGGSRKTAAIRGALRGGLVNVLITDHHTAERLIQPALADPRRPEPTLAASRTAKGPRQTRTGVARTLARRRQ